MNVVGAVAAGLLFSAGVTAVAWGLRPPLARLDREVEAVLGGRAAAPTPWHRWRERLAANTPSAVLPDLAVLGRAADDFLVSRLLWAAGGLAAGTFLAGAVGLAPWLLPAAGVVGALAGWVLAATPASFSARFQMLTL